MNPNAPEHQPGVARDVAVIRYATEKMFSDPDPETAVLVNKRITAFDELNRLREQIHAHNAKKVYPDRLPAYPLFSVISTDQSNVYTGVRINSKQGLHALSLENGTPVVCTQAYLEHICHYANRWHSSLSGIDCHSHGTDPKFFCFNQDFHKLLTEKSLEWMVEDTTQRLRKEQFWKLRYLFIPISFYPPNQNSLHVALCAISPEAKTLDYLCCGGDTGMPISPQKDGSKCVPRIFEWLAYYLKEEFLPFEWRLRNDAGHMQRDLGGDCGIYTVTTAMSLAFGYSLGAFPTDHQARILGRRRKYVQDLMENGFEFWNKSIDCKNKQYYPLLDTKPTATKEEAFYELPKALIAELPHHVAIRRKCYVDCPNKGLLKVHCKRNARFYPGWEAPKVSGAAVSLVDFIKWVEEMDHMRHGRQYKKGCKPLPYPQHRPSRWIDPRSEAKSAVPRKALWPTR